MSSPKVACVACGHEIDATAKLCPFCGGNPQTGEKFDPRPVLESHFPRKETLTPGEGALQFFRDRQAIVISAAILLSLAILFGVHRIMQARNANAVTDVPAVPLTEVTDLSNQAENDRPAEMPDLDFVYEGDPDTLRTLLMEPGAVAPVPPPGAQTGAAPGTPAAPAAAGQQLPAAQRPAGTAQRTPAPRVQPGAQPPPVRRQPPAAARQ